MLEAAIDFGGTLTNIVVVADDGSERLVTIPSVTRPSLSDVEGALAAAGCPDARALDHLVVTGGRTAALAEALAGLPLIAVDEVDATAAGGVMAGAAMPAIVVSIGTGTAIVLAKADGTATRLLGSGIGGATVLGLARLLVGPAEVGEYGALAARGDTSACDLTVGDIVGGAAGPVPAEATAAHFGRIGRAATERPRDEDILAGLVALVVQNAVRLALAELVTHGAASMVLIGGFLAEPGFRAAVDANPTLQRFPVPIAEQPGFAVVRGALCHARRLRAPASSGARP
jgi:type II pantothenate kinase